MVQPFLELGGMVGFAFVAARRATTSPFDYGAEFLRQFRFILRICLLPLLLTGFALSFGPAGIQAASFFGTFGALDRLGGAYQLIVVRLFAPQVVGIILAGAAATAICADLGARVVREEMNALRVLGVEPIKALVVPRVLAVVAAALLFDICAVLAGIVGLYVVSLQNGAELGPVFATFMGNATALELQASVLKAGMFGAIIGVVACYKGMRVAGDAEAVGRAVNQTVVIAFIAIGFTDYVFTQFLLATSPTLSQVRG